MKPQDIQDLKQLIEFLKQYQVAEFDLDRGDLKIRLKFHQQESAPTSLGDLARLLQSAPAAAAPAHVAATPTAASAPAAPASDPDDGLHVLKSPIVGTFYASPSPGAASFVSPGDRVEKGQVVCIVEAMKLMNEIEADASGEIVKCFVTNGQPIEFGQPLFAIRSA
ncbi:MAG TPA: acetyl-CoA carboxylase biotin carboxyl carrier protein [Terracidiphilus sp.]|nr:acetyl-CoA carboxylase biotin carboxyl carrier protein [Terracidiphilus sp.]